MIPLHDATPATSGGKAGSLGALMRAGLPVPDGFVVPPGADADAGALREARALLGPGLLAVRSSGFAEDGAAASFAGQHLTLLGVVGLEAVVAAVHACRASAFAPGVAAYRAATGAADADLAVLVQRQVAAVAAGVAFSRDPMGGDAVAVEAVVGLGESLVSGRATPERWRVAGVAAGRLGGPEVLAPGQALAVAAMARTCAAKLGGPQDIEWALDGDGVLWLLQSRPVTTGDDSLAGPPGLWTRSNAGELFPRVATPMTDALADFALRAGFGPTFTRLGVDLAGLTFVGHVAGRVYISVETFQAILGSLPGMGAANAADLFGGDAEAIRAALGDPTRTRRRLHVPLHRLFLGLAALGWGALRAQRVELGGALAEVRRGTDRWMAAPLAEATDAELLGRISAVFEPDAAWARCMDATPVGVTALGLVGRLCVRWLGAEDGGTLTNQLLTGMGGVESAESATDLAAVVEAGRALGPRLAVPWAELSSRQEPEDHAFVEVARAWLAKHGHHARGEADVAVPRFAEAPDEVLDLVRRLAARPLLATADRAGTLDALDASLGARLGAVRAALLRPLVARARRGLALREGLKSAFIGRLFVARRVILELGRRFTEAGRLDRIDDVFCLDLAELAHAIASPSEPLRARVRRRRRAMAMWAEVRPPSVILGAFDPSAALPPPPDDATVLHGLAVSAGVVEGLARVVESADAEVGLEPGEILVAPYTDPGWAPHFAAAAGLVVEEGGALSHGSVVARELGLPTVVNVRDATRVIRTGDRLRVDGFKGEVVRLGRGIGAVPALTAPPAD